MRRAVIEAVGLVAAVVMGYSAAQIPVPASAQGQTCPTQPAIVCVAMTVTPGFSATPTATNTAVPSATATASPTATATEDFSATPTQIVLGPTWTPGPSPTPEMVRMGLYSPYYQQRVRSGPGLQYGQVGWIGGGTLWAVFGRSASGDEWVFIEDRARNISGWVAVVLSGVKYGVYTPEKN